MNRIQLVFMNLRICDCFIGNHCYPLKPVSFRNNIKLLKRYYKKCS